MPRVQIRRRAHGERRIDHLTLFLGFSVLGCTSRRRTPSRTITCLSGVHRSDSFFLGTSQVAYFPAPDKPKTQRTADIHEAREDLHPQILRICGLGDRLRDRRRRHEHQPGDAEAAGEVTETEDLGGHGGTGSPVGACNGADEDGEERDETHAAGEDPDDEAEEAAEEGEERGDVDAAELIAEHAYEGPAEALAEVEQGADDAALVRREAHGEGEVGDAEEERDDAPTEEEEEFGPFQQRQVEGFKAAADGFVAVSEEVCTDQVYHAGDDAEDPECPT
ncbi:hypothetical protein GB937_001072 [Aspergillus fischeri]|nr:hypothetical protein GB937_001072 [Aspergillus fischeri]